MPCAAFPHYLERLNRERFMRVAASLLLLSLGTCALADTLPSFLNSNDTIRNLPVPNLPADAYRPTAAPLQVPEPGAAQAQPLLMSTKVTIKTLQIEGGTIYPLSELAALYQPLLGRESSVADLIEATRSITRRYQQDGYLLSYAFLPQQSFDNGVARVVLVEGDPDMAAALQRSAAGLPWAQVLAETQRIQSVALGRPAPARDTPCAAR